MESKKVTVSGRVQGVYFRDTCRRMALAAGVRGWVRNRPDGTVQALFEGEPDAVEQMVAWAHTGPPQAAVSAVEVTSVPASDPVGFRVVG
ncbi:acylphosphatase [Rhizocola hellebori]|uniref:acylphosphatase n=1 Tax=Rhizocola hellebori TaxID=1392758 RepID=UPI001EF260E4|nr:acylphosphatase [Rhizocola hellebori]